ncbi:MAG: RnfH family protein [Gammaproteobacteria bacterium]
MPIVVEIAPLTPQLEGLTGLRLPVGASVADALQVLALRPPPEVGLGVWGHRVESTDLLSDGDRIEFYRPLECDPKTARRARVARRDR